MADVCISTVGDRHALHFVTTAQQKKHGLPLTRCVSGASAAHCIIVNATQMQCDVACDERTVHSVERNSTTLQNTNKIRTFCNVGVPDLGTGQQEKSRARAFDFASAAHVTQAYSQAKKISEFASQTVCGSRIRSKMSESATTDSRPARPTVGI